MTNNPPLERTAAGVYFTGGRASRERRRGRSTAFRYPPRRNVMNNGAGGAWSTGGRIGVVIMLVVLLGGTLVEFYVRARRAKSAAERQFLLRWMWALGIEHALLAAGLLLLSVRGVVGLSI